MAAAVEEAEEAGDEMKPMWKITMVVIFVCIGLGIFNYYLVTSESVGGKPVVEGVAAEVASPMQEAIDISKLTLNRIFSLDHSWVKTLPSESVVTMIATGDVIPARSVNQGMVKRNNFSWPFEKTADFLKAADFTIINLETPLIAGCTPTIEGMIFCGDPKAVEGLLFAGVDIATLGNNHIGNYGEEGVLETEKILKDAGIAPVGNTVFYKEVKGIRFAFLAYNDIGAPEAGVSWADDTTITADVQEAKSTADIVIVSFHWGVEYTDVPTQRQINLAYATIDAGADVILGNHPHWIQPVELYKGKYIVYAHGNFVFDQEWSIETKLGVVGKYTFYDKKLVDVEYLPVRIEDYGQPYFLFPEEGSKTLKKMKEDSERMSENSIGQW